MYCIYYTLIKIWRKIVVKCCKNAEKIQPKKRHLIRINYNDTMFYSLCIVYGEKI